ncbi:hypothetical protein V8E51_014793 [Hyaloscypha variabilis]
MGNFHLRYAAIVTALCIHATDASSQCYWPNGEPAQANYVPCNSMASASACCANNDACTTPDTSDYQNLLSCSNGNLAPTGGESTWCCGITGSSTCCNSTFQLQVPSEPDIGLTGIAFKPDIFEPTVTITSTVTAGPSSGVIYTTVTTMVAATGASSPGSSLSNGAIAGVSIAAAIAAAALRA